VTILGQRALGLLLTIAINRRYRGRQDYLLVSPADCPATSTVCSWRKQMASRR